MRLAQASVARCYGGALACVAVALAMRAAFPSLLEGAPFAPAYLAVLVAARYFGRGPSILAIACGGIGTILLGSAIDWPRLLLFVVLALLMLWVVDVLRTARGEAETNSLLAQQRLAQMEKDAAQSAQLRAVVDSSDDAIISKDLDGIIRSWNHGAEQIFGYSAAEAIGQSIRVLLPPDRTHEESDIMERIRRGGRVKHFDTVRVRKDGAQIRVALTISPILDANEKIIGASHIARDVTERLELEEQMRRTQKLESVGVLAGGLAHDFNNLLTGIMGNASLAFDEAGTPERARARIAEILHASERAALLIRQMLAYAGKGRFVLERLDVSAQVREIVPLLQTSIPKLVEMDVRLTDNLPPVEADRSQIQQLIMNLALNAAEAIGDRPGKVTITTSLKGGEIVLEVKDTGSGMTDDVKSRIFDPFFTTKFTGRGLGLAAVMGIIRAQHGAISVATAPGQGSTFTVVLPAASGEIDAATTHPEADLQGEGRILVVDDEELVRNMARFTLERCGYTVEFACDGREALDRFGARPGEFTAVLLDLTMPALGGEDVLRAIHQTRADLPVVLSSGFTESEAMARFAELRVAGFLQKPYTASALARKIKQALQDAPAPRE